MKSRKVFSSNDVGETMLVRDALIHQDIAVSIQNAQSGRTAVPGFRPPAEIWLDDENDYERARPIVIDTLATIDSASEAGPWTCANCSEENPASFEFCWSCGREPGSQPQ